MGKQVRRVITGHNAQGRSCILKDRPAPNSMEMASMPDLLVTDLWETREARADNSGDRDNADRPIAARVAFVLVNAAPLQQRG